MSADTTSVDVGTQAPPEEFDEVAYLLAYPDIAESIRAGACKSALEHYNLYGESEQRLADSRYLRARATGDTAQFVPSHVDLVYTSRSLRCFVSGWAEDRDDAPLGHIAVTTPSDPSSNRRLVAIARCRRQDVEAQRSTSVQSLLGYWSIMNLSQPLGTDRQLQITLTVGFERRTFTCEAQVVSDEQLRDLAIGYLAGTRYFGDPTVDAFLQLDAGIGRSLIDLNMEVSRKVVAGAYVARYGKTRAAYDGSIIVCLYGKPDFLMLQAALFSRCKHHERYEFIYVSNSPELTERLVKDATIACRIYDVSITLVLLPGNAGFGAANNAAVNAARTDRILLVNPDVLPRDMEWPARHTEAVQNLPREQTALFGVPLYYDDGSLMHGGMYFAIEDGLSFSNQRIIRRDVMRTEHYGKGAPPQAREFLVPRPVPAVTGAFMSIDRAWFEFLGGFSPEFIFGHYEDGDLCLRSLEAGRPAWIHDLPFWHLESKGATHQSIHDGGRLVNRWNLTSRWSGFVKDELNGQHPRLFST